MFGNNEKHIKYNKKTFVCDLRLVANYNAVFFLSYRIPRTVYTVYKIIQYVLNYRKTTAIIITTSCFQLVYTFLKITRTVLKPITRMWHIYRDIIGNPLDRQCVFCIFWSFTIFELGFLRNSVSIFQLRDRHVWLVKTVEKKPEKHSVMWTHFTILVGDLINIALVNGNGCGETDDGFAGSRAGLVASRGCPR